MKKKKLIKNKIEKKSNENSDKKEIMSILLKIWLILLLIGTGGTAILCFIFNSFLIKIFPHVPSQIFYILSFFALAYAISVIALLKSKKWGFYLFFIIAIIIFIINIVRKLDIITNLIGFLVPLIITYFLLRPQWKSLR